MYYKKKYNRSAAKKKLLLKKKRKFVRRANKMVKHKPKLTVQRLKSYVPDILLTKLKGTYTVRNFRMTDLDEAIAVTGMEPGSSNNGTITSNAVFVCLNARPNGGRQYHVGRSFDSSTPYSPVSTPIYSDPYPNFLPATNYTAYRPYGMKVKIRVIPADAPENVGGTSVSGPVARGAQSIVVNPYSLSTIPFQTKDGGRGGYWNSSVTPVALSSDTIAQTKYGKRKTASAAGGKSSIYMSQYYDLSKIYGLNSSQWLASDNTRCRVTELNNVNEPNPTWEAWLMINVSEFCTDTLQTRYCNIIIDTVQYGRWEGPSIKTVE